MGVLGSERVRRMRMFSNVGDDPEPDSDSAFAFPPEVLLIRILFIVVLIACFICPMRQWCVINFNLHRGLFSRGGRRFVFDSEPAAVV